MTAFVATLAVALVAGPLAARGDRPAAARHDIVYSTDVATPHVAWAKPLAGGPVRGFFVPSVSHGRDMVELMQRLELEPTTVTIDRNWDVNCWGLGDFYGHEYRGDRDDFRTVMGYVEQELTGTKPFDVLLVPGLNGWSRLTRPTRDAILRRVRDGAGLVLLHPFVGDVEGHPFQGDEKEGDTRIWELSPLVGVQDDLVSDRGYPVLAEEAIAEGRWTVAEPHFITNALPLELLRGGAAGGRFYEYEAKGDVLIEAAGHPLLAVSSYGRGRVAALAYVEEGFLPEEREGARADETAWEYEYALLVRTLLWAARREGELAVPEARIARDGESIELVLESRAAREVELELGTGEPGDPGRKTIRRRLSLPAGRSHASLSLSGLRPPGGWAGGRTVIDVLVRDATDGGMLGSAAASFTRPRSATITAVKTGAEVYREGDVISVVVRAAGRLEGLRLRLELRDDLGRLVSSAEKPARGETYFFPNLDDFVGRRAFASAALVEGAGRLVHRLAHEGVLVVQRERRPKEYRALLSFETPPARFGALRQRILRAQAMVSGFTWGGKANDSLELPRGWFGVYWYDRGPTTPEGLEAAIRDYERTGDFGSLQYLTKLELFRRTGDKRFLARTPSLDDPEVQRVIAAVARSAARSRAALNLDYYFAGDEGSLSAYGDPVDFCWGEHTLGGLRRWLRGQYGSVEALNASWGSAFHDWDSVVPLTTDEARRSGRFAPWADHRTYMEVSFARAYQIARDAVREADAEGRIAVSGTQVTTPWNGCDWRRLDRVIDDFLSYSGGNQWEMHRSFAKPGARVGFWTGYGRSGAEVKHEIWTAALSGVLFPNLFWSPSVVNPDFTLSRSGEDMGDVFRALRFEGVGKLLMEAERVSEGIAIHYSMPSVHAAGILGLHGRRDGERTTFPVGRDGWVRTLTSLGLSPDFVASDQLEAGALDPSHTRAFVLPLSLALSDKEAAAVERFAEAGGVVIADAAAGLFDEHVARAREGRLDRLFGLQVSAGDTPPGSGVTGRVEATGEGRNWGLRPERLRGLAVVTASVTPSAAVPLLRVGGAPAAFVHRVNRGWAVYLNATFERCGGGEDDEDEATARGGGPCALLLGSILRHLRIEPAVTVAHAGGRPTEGVRISRYRFGAAELIGVLLAPQQASARYGVDGVTRYDRRASDVAARPVTIRLPHAAHVVNARTGQVLSDTDSVRTTLVEGDALILALNPARCGTLGLEAAAVAARGSHPALKLTASGGRRTLVRLHVRGPDGAFRPEYARNLSLEGTAEVRWPTALDDAAGRYRLKATDVLSGATAEATIRLE